MITQIKRIINNTKCYSDCAVVIGLQQRDIEIEEWFYQNSKKYYYEHFNEEFFDKDRKQEIFQSAFLKLWTEISNGKICVKDKKILRQQTNGRYEPMSCSLTTFLISFAKNEKREMWRKCSEVNCEFLFECDEVDFCERTDDTDEMELKMRLIDDCIMNLAPHCIEILTLFYYQGKNLDEIFEIRKDKNTTKSGLKTAKNKCMSALRERATMQWRRFDLNI